MPSIERALRVLRSQVRFEIVQSGARVAQATELSRRAQDWVDSLVQRRDQVASELTIAIEKPTFNPAQLALMQHLHQFESRALETWEQQLIDARRFEEESRVELARLRHRDRALERALADARRRETSERRKIDMADADDLWLQHANRTTS